MGAVALCMRRADDVEWIPIAQPPSDPPPPAPGDFPINLVQEYVDWLFSLPLSSTPQFAWYLLSLTRGMLLPTTPSPSILSDISSPPPTSLPPPLLPPSHALPCSSFTFTSFLFLTSTQTTEALSLLLHSRAHCLRLVQHLTAGPLLASFRISLCLLSLLHPCPSPLSLSSPVDTAPLMLLRCYHLSSLLPPLIRRTQWALSPAAVSDDGGGEEHGDWWMHEVSVEQLRLLAKHLARLHVLLKPDVGYVRAQQKALLLAAVRKGEGTAREEDERGVVNGLWGAVRDELWERNLLREMFNYVWE